MATRVELIRDLDSVIAARIARPAVERLTAQVAAEARARAPAAKTWVTAGDERVRRSHRDTDGQTIPANLRYKLPKMEYVRNVGYVQISGVDLARLPGDPALPVHQAINCRCQSVEVAGAIARSIRSTHVTLSGTRVTAQVYTDFHRAAESEFGTSGDQAAHFMAGAVRAAAARLESRARR